MGVLLCSVSPKMAAGGYPTYTRHNKRGGRSDRTPRLAVILAPPTSLGRGAMGETEGLRTRAVRRYNFRQEATERNDLRVCIPEVLDSQYGMYVWPCAVVLAQYVWFHREILAGKRILELGAGVSLPGVVAAKCGAEVTLSDSAELPECLENCRRSCQMNNLHGVKVFGLTWGDMSPELLALPPMDIILGSDVFYEPEDFEDVITSVSFLMERNPHAQFWTSYQVRSADWSVEDLLHKWCLKCIHVPLKTFGADGPHLADSDLPGRHTVQMMIVTAAEGAKTPT